MCLPHPLLGKLTVREMLFFTLYHGVHHARNVAQRTGLPSPSGVQYRPVESGPRIAAAGSPADVARVRTLLAEYAAIPVIAAHWTDSQPEIDALPGDFAPPGGALLLALDGAEALGCVALRPLEPPAIGELKRLYVRQSARGRGVGEALVRALMERARGAGYRRLRLDTIPSLNAARALYARLGFREIPQYRDDLYAGAVCYEIDLQ